MQAVDLCRCADESIHTADWPSERLSLRGQSPPGIGDQGVDSQNSSLKTHPQIISHPLVKAVSAEAERQALDPEAKLGKGHNAQIQSVFIRFSQPGNNAGIRSGLHPFRHHIGVEQKAHRSMSRG